MFTTEQLSVLKKGDEVVLHDKSSVTVELDSPVIDEESNMLTFSEGGAPIHASSILLYRKYAK